MSSRFRFEFPSDNTRPFGAHRYEVWSPKLQRRLRLFGDVALQAWVAIESDSRIQRLCERPVIMPDTKPPRVVDFWIQFSDASEEMWLILRQSEQMQDTKPGILCSAFAAWSGSEKIHLRLVSIQEIQLQRIAFDNWRMILQHLAANHALLGQNLIAEVLRDCKEGITIQRLESNFSETDPLLVRTAAFKLIHSGQIACENMLTARILPSSRLVPV